MTDKPVPPRPGPGGRVARLAQILRVDHAGELGAVHIYRGQRMVMSAAGGKSTLAGQLAELEAQEAVHLARFDTLLNENRSRPTLLAPLWRIAGFALGAGTALLGERAIHVCTEAVETVIEGHYGSQIIEIQEREPVLAAELAQFRDEELAHRDQAVDLGAHGAPSYALLAGVIRAGCRTAIKLAEHL